MTQPPYPPEPQPGVSPAEPPPAPAEPTEPENTVTEPQTEQPAESAQLPDVLQPNEGSGAEAPQQVAHPGVTNASPTLSPGVQGSAAKAWGVLSHIEQVVAAAKADIARYVPPEVLALGETEVQALIRSLL